MEETLSAAQEPEFNENLCANCQALPYEGNHPIKLCHGCRTQLINYPIPKWIKIFAIALAAVIVISIVRTQHYISAAINLGKSEKAIEHKTYVTAQKEIVKVLTKFPDDMLANADLFIAAAYNFDQQTASLAYSKIASKKVDDNELLARVNGAYDYLSENIPQDTTSAKRIDSISTDKEKLLLLFKELKSKNAEPVLLARIANYMYEFGDYKAIESILQPILNSKPDFYMALSLMAATKRELGKFDEAIQCCDRILATNKESVYAIAQKARIELKRKHDKQAAVYAAEAFAIDSQEDVALEAMAMVNYFAGNKQAAFKNLSIINAHLAISGDSTVSNRLTAIINGSKSYR